MKRRLMESLRESFLKLVGDYFKDAINRKRMLQRRQGLSKERFAKREKAADILGTKQYKKRVGEYFERLHAEEPAASRAAGKRSGEELGKAVSEDIIDRGMQSKKQELARKYSKFV